MSFELYPSSSFQRDLKKLLKREASLADEVGEILKQLVADPFYAGLKTHKLTGNLAPAWACSVAYDLRIVFEF